MNNVTDVTFDSSFNNIGIGTSSPDVTLHVANNDAIKIHVGTTLQRPLADASYHRGYIRFNTDTEQFEGFGAGESWAPLGGLTDIDKDTYITAENAPNSDNDQLKFFTDGTQRLTIDSFTT